MPRPQPNSNMQILDAVTDRHVIPVKDIDRPELTNLHVAATAATGNLTGAGAPSAFVPAVAATLARTSAGADNDLTFTAIPAGLAGNAYKLAILQPVTLNAVLTVGETLVYPADNIKHFWISLPTDGAGAPVAATATDVKTAWDAHANVAFATVVKEGSGAGTVAAAAEAAFTGGVAEIPATGAGVAAKGNMYTNNTNGAIYVNTGTLEAPVWTINA